MCFYIIRNIRYYIARENSFEVCVREPLQRNVAHHCVRKKIVYNKRAGLLM